MDFHLRASLRGGRGVTFLLFASSPYPKFPKRMLLNYSSLRAVILPVLVTSVALPLVSCNKARPDRMEIMEERAVFPSEGEIPESSNAMQRFGFGSQTQFRWVTPAGWKLMPGTQMRQLNFSFGPQGEGECYLSMTNGAVGATIAEINRWRKQMAQAPVETADLEVLPKLEFLKQPCPYLKLEGNYTPASGMMMAAAMPSEPKADYGLLGVVLEVPAMQAVLTVKLVGPKALVEKEEANFKAFATSLAPVVPQTAKP
jgi:hypothetical protein